MIIACGWHFTACLNLYFAYYDALLLGRGLIKQANQAISVAKIIYILLSVILLISDFRLLSISIASLFSVLINRYLFNKSYYDVFTKKVLKQTNNLDLREIFKGIWFNSKKMGLVSLGSYLIFQVNILIVGKLFTLSDVAILGLTFQIFGALSNFSRLYFNTLMPRFISLRMAKEFNLLRLDFLKSIKIGWIVYSFGALVVIFFGNFLLNFINSNTLLPNQMILFMFFLIYFMEITHGNCATFLTTKNIIPFLPATIISGVLIISLNLILIYFFNMGIFAFAIATIFIQLCYNAWKWPLEVVKDLNISLVGNKK
jgi:O-antigen/teichoic acid export membrane protein